MSGLGGSAFKWVHRYSAIQVASEEVKSEGLVIRCVNLCVQINLDVKYICVLCSLIGVLQAIDLIANA